MSLIDQLRAEYATRFAAEPAYLWALKYDPAQPRGTDGRWSEIRYGGAKVEQEEHDRVKREHDTNFAIFSYVQGGARHMNEHLRAGKIRYANRDEVALLDAHMQRNTLAEDTTLTRTIAGRVVETFTVGDVFQDNGYVSTTKNPEKLEGIRKDIGVKSDLQYTMRVLAPKGLGHIDVNAELGAHGYDNQEEVILPRGLQFQIVSKGPGRVMTVKALHESAKKVDLTFVKVLRWDEADHPRDKEGQFAFKRTPLEKKRRDFKALLRRDEREELQLSKMRAGIAEGWKTWSEEIKNRKRPLKPDGAAAKKLESYKRVEALSKAFHAQYEVVNEARKKRNAQALELLKVPPEQRSKVVFEENAKAPLHPGVVQHAKQALEVFKQFDGSGALATTVYPAEIGEKMMAQMRTLFGENVPMVKHPDGTYSIKVSLKLSKSPSARAFADISGIFLGGGRDLERSVFHEVAHHIEMRDSQVLKAALAFRESKVSTPREVYPLKTVNSALGDDEMAVRGDFPDPYMAKVYPKDLATEIVSMGVESYLQDPLSFARAHPDHFNLIFDIMQGKYRGTA